MRRPLVFVLLFAFGCASAKPAPTPAPVEPAPAAPVAAPTFAPPAAAAPTPFGGRAVIVPTRGLPLVSFRIAFQSGSIDDPKGKEGLTALTAQLMAEGGTLSLSSAELLEALFPMAAGISVGVDKELTVFEATVHRDHLERFLPILVDVLTRPRWDPAELERLRQDAIQGIERGLRSGNDEELGKAALDALMWAGHPYAPFVFGSVSGLKAITLEDVQAQAARVFTRERLVVGLAGAVDEALAKKLEQGLSALPASSAAPLALPAPGNAGPKVLVVEKEASSVAVSMGYPYALRRGHPDFYPMMVAVSALGEHRQFIGRLMKELRVKRGLNYGDFAYVEHFEQEGWSTLPGVNVPRRQQDFTIWLRPVPSDSAVFAIRAALFNVERFAREGLTQEELDTARGFLRGYTLLWEQTPSRRLGYAIDDLFYGTKDHLAEFRTALDAMTLEQVNAAVRRWIKPEELRIVAVAKDAQGLRQALLADGPVSLRYTAEKVDPAVAVDDEKISAFKLRLAPEQVEVVPVEKLFE